MSAREPTWDDLWAEAKRVNILAVAEQRLGAKLKREGHHWTGPCPLGCARHDGFIVTPTKGIFLCRPSGATGDIIDMTEHVLGIARMDALAFVLQRDLPGAPSRDRGAPSPRIAHKPIAPSNDDFWRERDRRMARAYAREIVPLISTPGERYLAEARKIDTDAIADVLERTDAFGWHPSVYFNEPGHPLHGQRLGCIIGVMTDAVTAEPTGAISRTYLDHEGRKVIKAKTLGIPAGIIRLTRDDEVLSGLHLAEGLETALDAMARSFRPMFSTGSANLMASFPVLGGVEALTIFADNDANGVGQRAARQAAERWLAAGREVHVFQRETTGDLNDAYREVKR